MRRNERCEAFHTSSWKHTIERHRAERECGPMELRARHPGPGAGGVRDMYPSLGSHLNHTSPE